MEVNDRLLFLIDRTIDRLCPSIQHDFHLIVFITDELHLERSLSHHAFNSSRPSIINADRDFVTFHIHCQLHVEAPIANFLPYILGMMLKLSLATVKHQERSSYIVGIQIVPTIIQGLQQPILMRSAEASIYSVFNKISIFYHLPKVSLIGGQPLDDKLLQCPLCRFKRTLTVLGMANQFGNHWVVSL